MLGIWGTVFDSTPEELDAQVDALVGGITEPYLALHGTDPGVDYANWLLDSMQTSVFEVWDDLGHYPHLVMPDTFIERVIEFDTEGI